MITGHVSALHLLVPVRFKMPDQPDVSIEFVVDTRFTGFLCLPQSAVDALKLPFSFDSDAQLADGSSVKLSVHDATIIWNGANIEVRVLATGKRPLPGTELLDGFELTAQFQEGGLVSIDPL